MQVASVAICMLCMETGFTWHLPSLSFCLDSGLKFDSDTQEPGGVVSLETSVDISGAVTSSNNSLSLESSLKDFELCSFLVTVSVHAVSWNFELLVFHSVQ